MTSVAPEYGSKDWQAERAKYIGASDVPAIVGVSPYATAYDVWVAKKLGVAQVENAAMEMGHLLEPVVATKYARQFPNVRLEMQGTVEHPKFDWLRATIDRMAHGEHGSWPLEIKSTSAYLGDNWGDEGSADIPDHVMVQVQTQLLVLGMSFAHVAVLIGGNDFRAPYVVEADLEMQDMILESVAGFRNRYLLGDEEPQIGGPNAETHLKRKYATHNDQMIESTTIVDGIIEQLAKAKTEIKDAELREADAKNALMAFIANNKGVVSRHGRITWSETKGRESVDTKGLIAHLNVPADVVQSFTKLGSPFRTFRFTAAK